MKTKLPINERFERQVVFRAARWLPLGLGALAVLALVVSLALLIYSFRSIEKPTLPSPIPVPATVTLTLEDVKKNLAPKNENPAPAGTGRKSAEPGPNKELLAKANTLAAEIGRLRSTLLQRDVSLTDIKGRKCTLEYAGRCFSHEDYVIRKGIGSEILSVLNLYDDETNAKTELVKIPDSDLTLNIRLDGKLETKETVIRELNGLLVKVPEIQTEEYVRSWVNLRLQKELAQRAAHEEQVNAQQAKYMAAIKKQEETVEASKSLRTTTTMALLGALAILVFSGVALAIIAIERHARAIQGMILNTLQSPKKEMASGDVNLSATEVLAEIPA